MVVMGGIAIGGLAGLGSRHGHLVSLDKSIF